MAVTRLFDFAYQFLEKFPKDDAFGMKVNNEWIKTSTLQYITQANKISRGLLKLGIKPGDKVALVSTNNRTEWPIMDVGLSQIGVINVPVYPTISAEDYEYIFNNAGIKYCFVSDKVLYDKIEKIRNKVESLEGIFTFEEVKGAPNWQEIMDLGEDDATQNEVDDIARAIKPYEVATIIYTSGTTGRPKGVMLTHENIVSNVLASDPRIPRTKTNYKDIRALSFLPICHVFERMLLYLYQNNGFSIYFAENMDKIGDNLKEIKPQYMTVVPRLLEKVFDRIHDTAIKMGGMKSKIFLWAVKQIENYDFNQPKTFSRMIADKLVFSKWREGLGGNIVTLVSGASALSPRINRIFNGAGIPVLEGYGLTETSPVISVNSFEKRKIGSVGQPLNNLKVVIAPDGEIIVKGPSITPGYYNDLEKTQEAFTEDGFFKTGEIGHIDDDGFLWITDRKKEMFKTSGGKYIAPQVIENEAKASKFIEQIMVVGDGEKMPCALIQPDFTFVKQWAKTHHVNLGETNEEICANPELKERIKQDIAKLNEKLGHWEQIKLFELTPVVWSIDNGLLTPTLKLKRKAVKEKFINLYNKMYGHTN